MGIPLCVAEQIAPVFMSTLWIMNEDQVRGRVKEVKGELKNVAGKIVGDKKLERKGKIQNVSGRVQAGYGDLKEDLKNTR